MNANLIAQLLKAKAKDYPVAHRLSKSRNV